MLRALQRIGRRLLGVRDAAPAPEVMHASEVFHGRVGRWDSNLTDRLNQGHWTKASGLPINAELAYAINNLRARTEYEASCNPIVEGLINTYAMDVVGPEGPSYRVTSSDPEYNRLREKVWRLWQRHAGANRQLALCDILCSWVRALWLAGEFGTQMINVQNAPGPCKMRLLPIHMHRLMTPPEMLGDPQVALGVRRDDNRNPLEYFISEPYIFGPYEVYTGKFDRVPYADFIHGFLLLEEDQVRGVPWLASCLSTLAQLRDFDESQLEAARMMAKTGVLWQLKNPEQTPTVIRASAPMERGQHTFGPPGYEASQLDPTQPTADQQAFRESKLSEVGRPKNMPLMMIRLDSSKHNYSSARFDGQLYWRGVATTQGWLGRVGLSRIEYTVIREAELAGELPEAPADCEVSWGWIKPPHVDPTKEGAAERLYMGNLTLPWSDAVIAHGDDPDEVLERLKRDKQRLQEAGLLAVPAAADAQAAAGGGRSPGQPNGAGAVERQETRVERLSTLAPRLSTRNGHVLQESR